MDTSIGAFVLPNAVIPDNTPLEIFKVPGKRYLSHAFYAL